MLMLCLFVVYWEVKHNSILHRIVNNSDLKNPKTFVYLNEIGFLLACNN